MDIKAILCTAATLMILSHQVGSTAVESNRQIIEDTLKYCKNKDSSNVDFATDPVTGLREYLLWSMNMAEYNKDVFKQQLQLRLKGDERSLKTIESVCFTDDTSVKEEIVKRLKPTKNTVQTQIELLKLVNVLDDARFKLHRGGLTEEDKSKLLDHIVNSVEKANNGGNSELTRLKIREVNFNDSDSMSSNFDAADQVFGTEGILKFGLQGFNDLFGAHQGIRRGETVVVAALQHKWKSGVLLTSLLQAINFNTPTFLVLPPPPEGQPDTRKALFLHITLENDALQDMLSAYAYLYENLTGKKASLVGMSQEEKEKAVDFVKRYMDYRGVEFRILQYKAGELTYSHIMDIVEEYKQLNYEIHMVTLDYMGKMSTRGCRNAMVGQDIQDLYQRLQNFFLTEKIAFITAHQLSTEAKALERDGEETLVKRVANLGYYAGCKSVDNEVDMEIFQHKIVINGKHYITWQRGKHRKPGVDTPEEMKFCIYQMQDIGSIPWDYGKDATFTRRMPGIGNGEVAVDMF